jgi:hypothetical protein
MAVIDNGRRGRLIIAGVFDGIAGVVGNRLAFVPNRFDRRPDLARGGVLDDQPIMIAPQKDPEGPFWSSRFEVLS